MSAVCLELHDMSIMEIILMDTLRFLKLKCNATEKFVALRVRTNPSIHNLRILNVNILTYYNKQQLHIHGTSIESLHFTTSELDLKSIISFKVLIWPSFLQWWFIRLLRWHFACQWRLWLMHLSTIPQAVMLNLLKIEFMHHLAW